MRLVTVSQAAKLTGIDISWIRRLCVSGRIKAHKYGPIWMMDANEALRYAAIPKVNARRPRRKAE
ncbi:MAG: hypothetical protein NVS9B15_25530 [Acidobacteriaceae bacterium]